MMREITVRLTDDGSVDQLLEGRWACLVWLEDNGDGTYSLHAGGVATGIDSPGEAYLRVAYEMAFSAIAPTPEHPDWDRQPPIAKRPPTVVVAGMMKRIRIRLGWEREVTE